MSYKNSLAAGLDYNINKWPPTVHFLITQSQWGNKKEVGYILSLIRLTTGYF